MTQIRVRRGTAAQWAASDPVLADGEPGWDTTNDVYKMGDGTLTWSNLPELGSGPGGSVAWADITGKPTEFPSEAHTHPVGDLETTGTPDGSKFLRDDGVWGVPGATPGEIDDALVASLVEDTGSDTRLALDVLYEGGGGLPAGIASPDDYTAIDGAVINAGTATTGFFATAGTVSTALVDGLTRVSTAIAAMANQTAGYNLSPSQSTTGQEFVVLEVAWAALDGYGGGSDMQHLMLADGASLTGGMSIVEMPALPPSKWVTMVIPVGSLATVASVGVVNDRGGYETGGQKIVNYWSNIRWANQTEADQALQEGAVLISPTYTPGIAVEINEPVEGKTRLNLDPDVAWMDGLGGVHHIREWGVPEDGLTECSAQIAKALSTLNPGDKMLFPPDGFYWMDYPVTVPSGIIVDFGGSTLFTRLFRGGNNNVQDPMLRIVGRDITVRNMRMFGYRMLTTNGSDFGTVSGSPTNSGNNKLLDAQGESVRVLTVNARDPWFARYPLVLFPTADRTKITTAYPTFALGNVWIFTLSDSAQVASDCVIEAVNTVTGVVEASRTLTLTGTPTEYVLAWEPTDLEAYVSVRVRKATATANTITLTSLRSFGFTQYSSSNDSANVIQIVGGTNITIEDFHIEGATTDAIDWTSVSNDGLVIRRGVSRASNRQGMSFNRGSNVSVSDVVVIGPHRSGIDVEPYDYPWLVKNAFFRNIRVIGSENYGMTFNNWGGVENFEVDGLTTVRCLAGGFIGGGRGGRMSNFNCDTPVLIRGVGVRADTITASQLSMPTGQVVFDSGSSLLATSTATGSNTNVVAVDSAANLAVGKRVVLMNNNAIVSARRVTNIAGLNVTFDGAALSWTTTQLRLYDGSALYDSRDNVASGVHLTDGLVAMVSGSNRILDVTTHAIQPHGGSLAAVVMPSSFGSRALEQDILTRQFSRSFPAAHSTDAPFVHGGMGLRGQPLFGVLGLGGTETTSTVQTASGQPVGRVTSSALDLGVRGLTVRLNAYAPALGGTNPRLTVSVEVSQDNTNWYPAGELRHLTAPGMNEPLVIRGCERYLRTSYLYTSDTGSGTVDLTVTATYSVPPQNLSGSFSGSSNTSQTVAFPTKGGPTIGNHGVGANASSGALSPSTTYYYRVGGRTRNRGPSTWFTEQSVALTAGQTAVTITVNFWHANPGFWTDGFSVLRGTSAGTYTTRFDVLPMAGVESFSYRYDFSNWIDLGTSLTPSSDFPNFPTTYPTASPKLTATDESGYEVDNSYRVFTMPAYTSVTKRVDGFDVTFASALTTFDWFIVR